HERRDQSAQDAEAVALVVEALGEHGEQQHHGADDLGGEVLHRVPDLGAGGEDAQYRAGALLLGLDRLRGGGLGARPADDLLVRQVDLELTVVRHPDQSGTNHRAEELSGEVDRDVAPVAVLDGEGHGDGGVEVGAGERSGDVDGRHDGETPPEGDGEPAGVTGLGGLQGHGGTHTAAEQDEYGGTD